MTVTTNYKVGQIDIGTIFGAKGASTAAATGYKVNGTDLNQLLLARTDGSDIGFNTGIEVSGTDLRNFFAQPNGNTPLPINGGNYTANAHSATVASVANIVFTMNSSGWALTSTQTPNGGGGTIDSGTLPTGAVTAQFTLTVTSSTASTSSSNSAPTNTTISATTLTASVQAN